MKKKLSRRYVAVTGRGLSKMATQLEKCVNKLMGENYSVTVEPKGSMGYMLHGVLQEPPPGMVMIGEEQLAALTAAAAGVGGTNASAVETDDSSDSGFNAKACSLLDLLFRKISAPKWSVVEKESAKILPQILQGSPAGEIDEVRIEFERVLKVHSESHSGDLTTCPFHRGLKALIEAMKESVRLSLC